MSSDDGGVGSRSKSSRDWSRWLRPPCEPAVRAEAAFFVVRADHFAVGRVEVVFLVVPPRPAGLAARLDVLRLPVRVDDAFLLLRPADAAALGRLDFFAFLAVAPAFLRAAARGTRLGAAGVFFLLEATFDLPLALRLAMMDVLSEP
jgi:hypothetical protein